LAPEFPSLSLKRGLNPKERRYIGTVVNLGSTGEDAMNNIIYLVGLVVVVAFIASFVLGNV